MLERNSKEIFIMKFYSEELNQLFNTEKELEEAEQQAKVKAYKEKQAKEKAAAERKARAVEVEEARKTMITAQNKYREILEAFCRDYGTYHVSLTGDDAKKSIPSLFDIFNPFLL